MPAGIKKVFLTSLATVAATDKEQVGTIRFEGNTFYKWVEFSGTTAVAVGDVVCYVLVDEDTGTIVDGANTALGAGVSVNAVPSGTVAYSWIQIKGPATISTAFEGSSPATGQAFTTQGATAPGVTICAAVTNPQYGVIADVNRKIIYANFPF